MKALSAAALRKMLEAAEILHAHGHGLFHERVFRAASFLFRDSTHSMELFGRTDGSYIPHINMPFNPSRLGGLLQRMTEIGPRDNPSFPHIVRGEKSPMRLSDLITARQFRNTELWQDVLREVDARYQIVIPLTTATHAGGVTINRGTRDFSDEEMALAVPFARHVILAFDSSNTLLRTEAEKPATPATLEPLERLGLTPRESEVLWWLSQGKRDREISLILGTSIRTVNHHVASVLRKLRVENRLAAISLLHRTCGSQPPPPSTAKHDSSLSGIPHSERANHLL